MIGIIYQILRTARPRQWLKNAALFAAPIFSGRLFKDDTFSLTLEAFVAFCLISSGGYFLNDIIDAPKDRLHPVKKNRPIASKKLPVSIAVFVCILLLCGTVAYSYVNIGKFFAYSLIFYIFVQIIYSFYLRNVIIMDSLTVASFFVIRVFAGSFASRSSISSWLALTTIGISLLLAFGKRRSEKTILENYHVEQETRKTLRHYPDNLLNSMITMAATYTIITYSIFTFENSPERLSNDLINILPSVLRAPKLMMVTIPLVLYGVARYLYVIYEKEEGESPERVLLSDKPLLLGVFMWGLSVLGIVYLLPVLS